MAQVLYRAPHEHCIRLDLPVATVAVWLEALNLWCGGEWDRETIWDELEAAGQHLGVTKKAFTELLASLEVEYYPSSDRMPIACGGVIFLRLRPHRYVTPRKPSCQVLVEDGHTIVLELRAPSIEMFINDFDGAERYIRSLDATYRYGYSKLTSFDIYGDKALVVLTK